MKVFAHVRPDGSIQGLVAIPEGERSAMLTPMPGVQVCEIVDDNIQGETVDFKQLHKLLETHTVVITPAQGRFVRRNE